MIFMIFNVASQYSLENELKGKTKGKIKRQSPSAKFEV